MGREKVPWRWSEDEFLELLDKYLEEKVKELKEKCNNEDTKSAVRTKMLSNIRHYYQIDHPETKRQYGCKALDCDVRGWIDISSNANTSLEEIMIRAIASERYNLSLICYSFVCINQNLNEDYIDDLMFVCSGLFSFDKADDKYKFAVLDAIDKGPSYDPTTDKNLIKLYGRDNIPKRLRDCIDWSAISLNNKSGSFIARHSALFPPKYKM